MLQLAAPFGRPRPGKVHGERRAGEHPPSPLPPALTRAKEVVHGLGLWPSPEGHEVEGEHWVLDSPQAVSKGALQGLGLGLAHGGCAPTEHGAQHQRAPGCAGQEAAREPKGAQQLMWGEGDHNHALPPSGKGQWQQRAPSGNVVATPPTVVGTEEDHNFPLPQPEVKEVVQDLSQWPAPEGQGGDHSNPLPKPSAHSPPLLQMGEKEVVQGPRPVAGPRRRGEAAGVDQQQQPPTNGRVHRGVG